MMDLYSGERGNLNTFHGHSFFVKPNKKPNEKGGDTALLSESIYHFTVHFSQTEYEIGFKSKDEENRYKPIRGVIFNPHILLNLLTCDCSLIGISVLPS